MPLAQCRAIAARDPPRCFHTSSSPVGAITDDNELATAMVCLNDKRHWPARFGRKRATGPECRYDHGVAQDFGGDPLAVALIGEQRPIRAAVMKLAPLHPLGESSRSVEVGPTTMPPAIEKREVYPGQSCSRLRLNGRPRGVRERGQSTCQ